LPALQLASDAHLGAALRAAPDDDERLAALVASGVKRRVGGKHTGHAPDSQAGIGIVIKSHRRVGSALKNERVANAPAHVFGGDEAVRGNDGAAKDAPGPFKLPAAVGQ
jgi:hypothetical protein